MDVVPSTVISSFQEIVFLKSDSGRGGRGPMFLDLLGEGGWGWWWCGATLVWWRNTVEVWEGRAGGGGAAFKHWHLKTVRLHVSRWKLLSRDESLPKYPVTYLWGVWVEGSGGADIIGARMKILFMWHLCNFISNSDLWGSLFLIYWSTVCWILGN